ncbi:hypothetical protein CCHR01_03565 [Colletotrichum chrysophilum]|uniref:Uncharacterized protein n=1 Tax=Colletotrichum chrysophilum TaxID=1836956 RepID=A0AAD9ENG9_9PEZI|nr:hypothetical protein CCHR01_03565 [Colletotrichum chrysophilum]
MFRAAIAALIIGPSDTNSPFAMGMPSCNGRLQPREVNGAL